MAHGVLVTAMVLVPLAMAHADATFLHRDGPVTPAYMYPDGDGADPTAAERIEDTAPPSRTLVVGPTFRNDRDQTEVGAGFGYVDGGAFVPFELSVEPTWVRVKRVAEDRNFRKIRLAASAQVWKRRSSREGTAVALTGFFSNQNDTSSTIEVGAAVTQVIGERLSVSANVDWGREYLRSGPTTDTAIAAFGTSYYLGAGVRFGGFYQLYNRIDAADDWGMFLSYELLPFAELVVEGGKNQFVLAKVLVSYDVR